MASENYTCNAEPSIINSEEGETEQIASGTHFVYIHDIKREIKEESTEFKPYSEYEVPNECLEKHNLKINDINSRGFEVMLRNSVEDPRETKISSTCEWESTNVNDLAGELATPKVNHFNNGAILKNENEDHSEYIDLLSNNAGLKMETLKTKDDIDIIYEDVKPEICEEIGQNFSHELSKDSETWPQHNIEEDGKAVERDNDSRKEPTITIDSKNCEYDPFQSKQEFNEIPHTGKKPFQCKSCSKSYSEKRNLLRHERVHRGEKPFQCELCLKSFGEKQKLLRHERTHTGEKPYQCKLCSKLYTQKEHLTVHERIHTGEKPYQCKICLESFAKKRKLLRHERIHAKEKPFHCKTCPKSFAVEAMFLSHQIIHTEKKTIQCKFCPKSFEVLSKLLQHERIHTGERPFQCKSCSKHFHLKQSWLRHERIHTGEKPFQCKFCLKSFARKSRLVRHEKIHIGSKSIQC